MPTPGPCTPWVTPTVVAERPDMADTDIETGVIAGACTDASDLLFSLSGRQFPGACTSTVRPTGTCYGCCHATHLDRWAAVDSITAATNGFGFGWPCDGGGLDLGLYPIRSITSVKINGQVVSSGQYRVDGQRWLIRPGVIYWPPDRRPDLPDTADGTFSVTATHGADPPTSGVSAASLLAAELAKARSNLPNRLPQRITHLTRQGVSMTVVDPQRYLSEGLLGIWEIDLFLRSSNPARQTARPLVYSPDLPRRRRV